MAITFGFYNSNNGDRKYDAEDFASIFDGMVGDGVHEYIGGKLMVKAGEGMHVNVQTGRAWFNHTWTMNDTVLPFEVPAANPSLSRIDAVVLRIDASPGVRANSILYITGTASTSPSYPDLTNTEYVHEYPLAYINVNAGVTMITQSAITNTVGTSVCPFVMSLVQLMSIDDMEAQWNSEWREWLILKKANQQIWEDDAHADFAEWFSNLQVQLDGDVAAHLQNEIDHATGSIVTITTDDAQYYGQTIQLDGPDTHMSGTMPDTGKLVFTGIKDIGQITIYSDNADNVTYLTIPYFGNYTVDLSPWQATINVNVVTTSLRGKPILVSGPGVETAIAQDEYGDASIVVKRAGTYTFTIETEE